MKIPPSFLAILSLFALQPPGHAVLRIGGFDTFRAGSGSIVEGPVTTEMRAAVMNAFPGAVFLSSPVFSADFLNTVDIVIAGAATLDTPITLSLEEQANLFAFVNAGGGALIYTDNDSYAGMPASDLANESFLDPFSVDSTGAINSPAAASTLSPDHPVMAGPFGTVTTFATHFPGWFDVPGPFVQVLSSYNANLQPAVLAISPGSLSATSGGVVFMGDATPLADGAVGGYFPLGDNTALILNSIAFVAVPEPSVASLGLLAAAGFAARRRRAP